MGISAACHRFLLQAHQKAKFSGTLVTLGRQDIWISGDEFNNTATQLGCELRAQEKRYPERIPANYFSKNWMTALILRVSAFQATSPLMQTHMKARISSLISEAMIFLTIWLDHATSSLISA